MQQEGSMQEAGFRKGLEDFSNLKTIMDDQLLRGRFPGWNRTIVTFKGPLSIVSTGAVSPIRDFEGRELQALHDPNALIQELLFGIVAAGNGGAVVFLCRADEKIPQVFVQSMLRHDRERIGSLIAQFAFVYIANTYFSKEWWDNLSSVNRRKMESLAWVADAYEEPFTYSPSRKIVPWEITSIDVSED